MLSSIKHILIDTADPQKLAKFWCDATGLKVENDYGEFITLEKTADFPTLAFYKVPDKKVGKNRLHLDFKVDNEDAEAKRLVDLGGQELSKHANGDFHWRVMADPEGNEFCISAQW